MGDKRQAGGEEEVEEEDSPEPCREPGPVDSGYSWVVLVAAFLVVMVHPINNMSFGVFLPELVYYYNLPVAVLGVMGAVRTAVLFATGALTSPLVERYGCRSVAIMGVILATLGNILSFCAKSSYIMLFVSFGVIAAAGGGCMYIPSQVIVQHYFHRHRALAAGIASAGLSFGSLVMSPLMRLSIDHYGMRGGLLTVAAMSLQCLVPAMLFFPHPRTRLKHRKSRGRFENLNSVVKEGDLDSRVTFASGQHKIINVRSNSQCENEVQKAPLTGEDNAIETVKSSQQDTKSRENSTLFKFIQSVSDTLDLHLLRDCGFLLLACSTMPTHVGVATWNSYSIQRAILLGVPPITATFIFTSLGTGSLLGRFMTGLIGNLSCSNRTVQYGVSAFMVGVSILASVVHTASAAFHITMGGLVGFFVGCYQGLIATVAVDIVGLERLPQAMGWLQFPRAIGALIIIPLGGWLYDITGDYSATFISCGTVQCMGGLMAMSVALIHRRSTHDVPHKDISVT